MSDDWETVERNARDEQDRVRQALGIKHWGADTPIPGHQPPHWARNYGNDDTGYQPRFDAINAMWLVELGVHRMIQAANGQAGPAVKQLADITCEKMAHGRDFQLLAGDDWDPSMRFFSEATLYPLVGKEMAHTILALINGVKSATGS